MEWTTILKARGDNYLKQQQILILYHSACSHITNWIAAYCKKKNCANFLEITSMDSSKNFIQWNCVFTGQRPSLSGFRNLSKKLWDCLRIQAFHIWFKCFHCWFTTIRSCQDLPTLATVMDSDFFPLLNWNKTIKWDRIIKIYHLHRKITTL